MPLVVEEVLVGAAVGAAASELLKAILHASDKICEFKYDVDRLKFTLEFIISRIVEIEVLDKKLDYPKTSDIRLIEELDKAKDLIRKCSKVKRNLVKKRWYSDKLKKLNDSLERFFSLNVNVEFWSKRILVNLQEANEKFAPFNLIETSVGSGNVDQKQVWVNLQEVGWKLNLIERSVERGNVDKKWVLSYLQELGGKLDQSNLIETSVGSGNVDQRQVLVHMQEVIRKLDQLIFIETSVGSGNVDQNVYRCAIPEIPNCSVGMDAPIEELKMELFRDDVSMIGLCAIVGSGKTTLAAKLCRNEQVKERFKDNIIFLTISSLPDFKVIVEGIFKQLGIRNQLIKFQNDEDAEKQLRYLMKRKEEPILLVLDDVWEESFLEKFEFGTVRHKILVTSRIEYKSFDFTYSLKMLSDQDSMNLFHCLAFPQDGSYEMPDKDCVKQIARCCKGVPLILKVIARSLRGEPARKWKSIEKTLRKGSSIFDIENDLLERLATCLDFLDDNVRECFLDLGSFSEDQRITASVLIDIWSELYDLDEDKAYVNLLELSSRNLINLLDESVGKDAGKIDGNLNELFVTQQDILRDLAIYKSRDCQNINQRKRLMMDRKNNKIPMSREQDDQPFDACLVSIILTDEMLSSGWIKMQFPKVKVLIISRVSLENEQFEGSDFLRKLKTSSNGILNRKVILPMVVKKMSNLKVLIISNRESHDPDLIGCSSVAYLSQLKILRLEKIWYPSLNKINKPLKNLQKISLVECTFRLGWTFNKISYIFPNLLEIDINHCYNLKALPQRICKIRHLKKLSVTECSYLTELPKQIGDLTELEVLRLCGCVNLLDLPDSIRRLGKLRFLDISACTGLQKMPEGLGELCSLRKLNMRRCSSVRRLPRSAMDLRLLENVICDEEMGILWKALVTCLPDLNIQVD